MQQSPRSHFHFHALDSLPQSTRSLGILLAKQPPRGLVRVNFPRERLMAPVLEMLMPFFAARIYRLIPHGPLGLVSA
jgi:hypothetical protein